MATKHTIAHSTAQALMAQMRAEHPNKAKAHITAQLAAQLDAEE